MPPLPLTPVISGAPSVAAATGAAPEAVAAAASAAVAAAPAAATLAAARLSRLPLSVAVTSLTRVAKPSFASLSRSLGERTSTAVHAEVVKLLLLVKRPDLPPSGPLRTWELTATTWTSTALPPLPLTWVATSVAPKVLFLWLAARPSLLTPLLFVLLLLPVGLLGKRGGWRLSGGAIVRLSMLSSIMMREDSLQCWGHLDSRFRHGGA